jgi:hypothetical protein
MMDMTMAILYYTGMGLNPRTGATRLLMTGSRFQHWRDRRCAWEGGRDKGRGKTPRL